MDTRTVEKQALAGALIVTGGGNGNEGNGGGSGSGNGGTTGTAWLLASRRSRLNRESS